MPVKWGSMKGGGGGGDREGDRGGGGGLSGMFLVLKVFSILTLENYHGMVDYDLSKIKITFIDIETSSEYGFPNIREA